MIEGESPINERFDAKFIDKNMKIAEVKKVFICGPPVMN